MRVRRVAAVLIAGVVLVTAAAGCGRAPRPSSIDGTATPQQSESLGLTVIPPDEREPAPVLAGQTLDGQELDVATLRGRPVLVNAWASWCAPCREEIPVLQDLSADHPRIEVVGLDVLDRQDAARAFVTDMGVPWPSIADPTGELLATIPGVPPKALPSTIVIDREGRVSARVIGPVTPSMVPDLVKAAR